MLPLGQGAGVSLVELVQRTAGAAKGTAFLHGIRVD